MGEGAGRRKVSSKVRAAVSKQLEERKTKGLPLSSDDDDSRNESQRLSPVAKKVAAAQSKTSNVKMAPMSAVMKKSKEQYYLRRNTMWIALKEFKWIIQGGCNGPGIPGEPRKPCPCHSILSDLIKRDGFAVHVLRFQFEHPDPDSKPAVGFRKDGTLENIFLQIRIVNLCCHECAYLKTIANGDTRKNRKTSLQPAIEKQKQSM